MTSEFAFLQSLSDKGVNPQDPEERASLLSSLGFHLWSYYHVETYISMLHENTCPKTGEVMIPWPFEISVDYCDPLLQVARVSIYFAPLKITLEHWMDIETIREAGSSPVLMADGTQMDMAFMCEAQNQQMYESMFMQPVVKDKELHWPELTYHVQYVFDVLYGCNHTYKGSDGNYYRQLTNIDQAKAWRDHAIKLGYKKYEQLLSTERYQQFCNHLLYVETQVEETKAVHSKEEVLSNIRKLSSRL